MRTLQRFEHYTRKEAHDIFDPNSKYTRGAGSWGISGIIRISQTHDYVFFVTLGSAQSHHIFDEGISNSGILNWQSQPQQSLSTPMIKAFMNHKSAVNNIYLFYRQDRSASYCFLGLLDYLAHDPNKEKPVYFQWQILDWDPPTNIMNAFVSNETLFTPSPQNRKKNTPTQQTQNIDFAAQNIIKSEIGDLGEEIILQYERLLLSLAGRPDLAKKVVLTKDVLGNTAPYDIQSFDIQGNEKYIEVKTTTGELTTPFYISARELEFARHHADNYVLYRLYRLNRITKKAEFEIMTDIERICSFEPANYQVKII